MDALLKHTDSEKARHLIGSGTWVEKHDSSFGNIHIKPKRRLLFEPGAAREQYRAQPTSHTRRDIKIYK